MKKLPLHLFFSLGSSSILFAITSVSIMGKLMMLVERTRVRQKSKVEAEFVKES